MGLKNLSFRLFQMEKFIKIGVRVLMDLKNLFRTLPSGETFNWQMSPDGSKK